MVLSASDVGGTATRLTLEPSLDGAQFTLGASSPSSGDRITATLSFVDPPDHENPQDTATPVGDVARDNIYLVDVTLNVLSDGGDERPTETTRIRIRITNIDDNDPVLTNTRTSYNEPENSINGVVFLQGTDADGDFVRFEIVDGAASPDKDHFTIHGFKNRLGFASPQDFEMPNDANGDGIYNITVRATSTSGSGNPSRTSNSLALEITLTDINEDEPRIIGALSSNPFYNFRTGSTGIIDAFRIVGSDAGTFSFSPLEVSPGRTADLTSFHFDTNTGVLSFSGPSPNARTYLLIQATSSTGRKARRLIIVRSDIKSLVPRSFSLPEDRVPPQVQFTATDPDGPPPFLTLLFGNSVIGLDTDLFTLVNNRVGDTNTATLTFNAQPDFENPIDVADRDISGLIVDPAGDNAYVALFSIESVNSSGDIVHNTATTVKVRVTNVDDGPTLFPTDQSTYEVLENTTEPIVTLRGADADADTLRFEIVDGAASPDKDHFFLHPSTGVLRFASAQDYEDPSDVDGDRTYHITVQVASGNPSRASNTQMLEITLINDDDNDPTIAPIQATYNLTGTTGTIATFTIVGSDADETRTFGALEAAPGSSLTNFSFDTASGVLSFAEAATAGTSALIIRATSNSKPAMLAITIRASDDLALDTPANQNYTQGRAITDLTLPAATGGKAPLTYTLTSVPGLDFNADTRRLSGTPDTAGTFDLTYEVTDANGASENATFMVIVNVGLALSARGDQNYTLDTEIDDLTLPVATGGKAPLTYTLTSVPGLNFNANTRRLSGTPDTAGTTTLTYEVMDANGTSASVDFMVIVSDSLALTASGNQNYTLGTTIPDLQLPAATGGTAPLTYTLFRPGDGALPGGLNFNANTRTLSGTPTTAGASALTYRVSDANGASTSVGFTVIVNASLALTALGNQNYTQGTAITALTLPAATGGTAPLTYTLTRPGGLPGGLEFDADTRTLSGTLANTASTFDLTYEVTDDNGASTNATFRVTVNASLTLDTPDDQNYTLDTAITGLELPEARGGREPLTYTLTGPGDLLGGLEFDADTRTLSGTPNTAGTTTLTYEVTDANGASTNTTFTVIVSDGLTLTASGNQNYTLDTAITDLQLPVATGGTGTLQYTLTGPGDLLGGLEFDADTRTLSGTPNTADTTTLTYEVTDANGASTSVDFTVTVNASLTLDTPDDQNYTLDTAITGLPLPAATGGTAPLTYTLTRPGGLPGGLEFDPGTRTLSGTPNTADTTTLTYMVTDANGASTSVDFTVTVNASLTLDTPDDQNYTLDTTITGLELPVATGGTAPLTYTLTRPGGSALPGGLTFTPGTRTLSGTPSMAATTTLTYRVTDTNGASTNTTFTVTVNASLTLDTPDDQNYTLDTAIPDLQLPVATGGTGTLTYTLIRPGDSALPGGLNFDPGTRTLSGTPNTADTTTLTYEVTDANGANTSVDFTVTVNASLTLTASGNQNYTLDTAIPGLPLPAATGGTAPLTYTLTRPGGSALPGGLTFTPGTRTLSGTPSMAATTTLTYRVTDTNGASTNTTFTVIVSDGLTLTASGNQNYTLDTAITDLQLPVAIGGTRTLQYTLTGPGGSNLPGGLNFTPDTRTLSGTPNTAGTTTLTYEVTDANGASTNTTFTVIVSDGLTLTASGNQNYTLDTAIPGLPLPAATGGTAPLTYTLTRPGGSALPGGLEFDPGTRTLSGTPNTAGTTTLTYMVTDANGANTSVDFTVTVSEGLALSARGNQNYTQGTAITALSLPMATGGTGTLTYTLTGPGDSALPGGLTFTAGTRTLSGTPNTAGTTTLTYEVTDANGASTNATFTVIVSDGLALSARGNQNYTQGRAITALSLPMATGGKAPLTYTLTSVPGLTFTAGTRTLSGTPNTAGTTTLTYEVTDANGASTNATFTVTVNASLALTASGNQNYTLDTAIPDLQLPVATGGTGTLTYTLIRPGDSALPGGLNFNANTRTLSGTPNTAGASILTYRVSDANNANTSVTFTVIVSDGLALTASGNQIYTMATAITALSLPMATGGTAPLTYTLTSVPGLTFNANTRTLSGTPNTAGTTTLTYEVTDANGASTNATFMVTVNASLTLTASGNQNYTQGTAITALTLPAATGGTAPLTYTLTGPGGLPGGLEFDADTRTLSGTPTSRASTTTLTYRVTDTNNASTNATFTVIVSDSLALTAPANQNYTLDTAITGLTLPEASGGTAPLTYTLTGPGDGNLPGGLTFGSRILSGTPDTAATTTLTYEVTDANGASTTATFMVTVNASLTLTASGNQNYTLDTAIPALELPAATGGTAPLTYTLTSVPGGLTFTPATRTLSGTPDTDGDFTLTYRVTDTNGASTSVDFTVTVNASLTLTASGDQNYTLDTAITDLTLPAATGGTAPLTYTLTSVPGLTFTPGSRILSGTPSTAATTPLTYEVMDANGASTTATFTVIVSDSLALDTPANQNYTRGTAITDLQLPVATGGTAPLTYTLTSVPGLDFNANNRTLSGTPNTAATTELTYIATDDNGSTAMDTFTITVADEVEVTAPNDQTYTMNTTITDLTLDPATGGTGTVTYTLAPLPDGLTFTATTRVLSGTPTTADTTVLTYIATDDNGSTAMDTFTITVADEVEVTAPNDQTYTMNTAITALTLALATGGTTPVTYTLAPLPNGLLFNATTRVLSGTPSTAATTPLTYEVMDANGASTSVDFTVTVNASLTLTASGDQNYTLDTAITDLTLPAATGGTAPLTYTLTSVPGLTFTPGTRTLSGTPDMAATTTLTYRVTDTNGASMDATFTVTVNASLALDTPADQNYTLDTAITGLTLPAATGGTAPLTYTLTNVPGGLDFDPGTRMLSGTPDTAATTTLTYEVSDANNASTTATFMVIVSDSLALTAPANQNYTRGTAITALTLPAATGGTVPLTYTLTSVPGLEFDADTRILSGTPDTAATTTLTYEVTDANGASTNATFTVTVNASLTLSTSGHQNYTQGTAIPDLPLPEARGGTASLTYTLTGPGDSALPGGLIFDIDTRTLSGTPNTPDITTLTYRVTDANGASTRVLFVVTVNASLTLTALGNQNYTQGTAIPDLQLPVATGGTGTPTYTLTGPGDSALPAGLTFTANTRTLSGTPNMPDVTTLTYRVTDTNNASTTATFTVTVNASLTLSTSGHQNYTQGTAIPDLPLPEARGGTASLTYTLTGPGDSALPGGLIFDIDTRTLSGTPNTPDITTLTYRVTDANGASTRVLFVVTVNASLTLTALGNQNYTQGTAIPDLQLPAATGGTGTPTYTLTGPGDSALPGGLIFDIDTRTLSGTPDTADITTLTYRVTDANNASTRALFVVTVNASLTLTALGNQNYTQGTAIPDLELPEATGGTAPLTYTLTGPGDSALPGGLDFNANNRTLSGTPNTAATTELTYIATDDNGSTAMDTFTITVADEVEVTAPNDQTYTMNTTITDLTLDPATGGTGTVTYTLAPLPDGLTFTAGTRVLSGTPTTADTTELTYIATDDNGSTAMDTFTVIVAARVAVTAPNDQTYTMNTTITGLALPEATGGTAPLTYTLTSVLGLSFNANTRTLSGTPNTAATTTLTYRVTDTNGASTSVDFTVTVNASLALDTPANQNYTQGTAITDLELPAATGGTAPLTYTLTSVPGLTFTPDTRTLSGTPTTAATTTLTYEVMDANGASTSVDFTVTVNASLALDTPANQNYTQGTAITDLELPAAAGGTAPLTYTLTSVPGLDFNANNRTLSGTPTTAATTTLTYEVMDANGASMDATFTVTVNASLTLTASGNQNYTQGTAITALELPVAAGGTAPLTYTLTSVPGLDFNANNRTLSGTPNTAATTTLTYEVSDANGASMDATFTVTVNASLTLTASGNQNYTQGTAITALELPVAAGGTAPLTYTLTSVPGGLIFTPATRTLSGTPDTDGNFTLTYRVTDTNGASTSVDFMVIVNASLALDTPANQNYTRGTAITDLELPVAAGGTGTVTYTLAPLPDGLTFTATTRVLSGTPTTTDTTELTYAATDDNGSTAMDTFTITVADEVEVTAPGDQTYTMDTAITDLTLDPATGGTGTVTYTLAPLPDGLTFTATTRVLSGTPTTTDTTELTYAATDDNGSTAMDTFTVIVAARVAVTAPGDQTYTMNTAITALTLAPTTGGTGTVTYTLAPLPNGLIFNATTRVLSGTPTTTDTTELTYAATDDNGSTAMDTFTVTVADEVEVTAPVDQTYTMDTAITDLGLPMATGGTGTVTYTLAPLPNGLIFNETTRVLSGTPTAMETVTATYTATDDNGSTAMDTFTVTVADEVEVTAPVDQTYTMDTAITDLTLPEAAGGTTPVTYTLTPLPNGLTFTATTRVLSGTPSTADTTTLTYEVTDTNGASTSVDFTVIVNASLTLDTPVDQTYTMDTAITDLGLPMATGGTGTVTYTLAPLPNGLIFNATTRVLSGTPTTTATTELTYIATDDNGSTAMDTFTITVADEVEVTAPNDQTYTMNTTITDLSLPMATGGTGTVTYTLAPLPNGLIFNATTRVLSGTPTTTDTTELTYTATDDNGSTAMDTFTVIVAAGVAVTAPGDQTYTMGTAITALTLTPATGGTTPVTYTLAPLPNGLIFNATTRVLSGTPTTTDTTELTYTATDDNGSTAMDTFTVTVADEVEVTAPGDQTYTMDTAITALTLTPATGGTTPVTYTLAPLPNGLIFNATTRVLSGTPTTTDTTELTYTATDDNGSTAMDTFTVTVADEVEVTAPGDQTYTMDTAITALSLPMATGGTAPLTYTLTSVPGLNFNRRHTHAVWHAEHA